MSPSTLRISIIVATYNRSTYLLRTLRSLAQQSLDRALWEIVVVNNNSSDDTPEQVAKFISEHPELQIVAVTETQQGLSHARNAGIRASSGEFLLFVDDDEEMNEEYLSCYLSLFEEHPDAMGAGGIMTPLYEYPVPKWISPLTEQPISGSINLGKEVRLFPKHKYPIGGNMGFRRTAIKRYGDFDTGLGRTGNAPMGGEEKELFGRLKAGGEKIYYLPGAVIYHIIPESKFDTDYFQRLNYLNGVSERHRTLQIGRSAYLKHLLVEAIKWGVILPLALYYTLRGTPIKGNYLIKMRYQISRGLLGL